MPLLACVGALASLPGCVHALKEPPPLEELGSDRVGIPVSGDLDALLHRAQFLYATRALGEVREAVALYLQAARADGSRVEGLLGAARAQVWIVDHEADAADKEEAALGAVHAAQWCLRIAPENPACDYWLGAALGVQARERRSTALDALPRIEEAFRIAAEKDPALEQGGPHRALALLYARAPGWPSGPGDPDRALEEALKAVELRPEYPPNQMALGEALGLTGDPRRAREAFSLALELANSLKAAGDPDAWEWIREAEEALTRKPAVP